MNTSQHPYEHPIFWNKETRRHVEEQIARDSLAECRQRREQERIQKILDRAQIREMMSKHCPWGKPGGGAPNESIRIRNIALDGIYPETKSDCRNPLSIGKVKNAAGGGGAPIRSASGRMLTTFRDDPLISFNDPLRKHVDIELRYKSTPVKKRNYKLQLDKICADREKEKSNELLMKRRSSDVVNATESPWGKAGPGGVQWRNQTNIGTGFMRSMGWTNKELLRSLDTEPFIQLNSKKDNFKAGRKSSVFTQCCDKCTCECISKTFIQNQEAKRLKLLNEEKALRIQNINRQQMEKLKDNGGVELVPLLARRRAEQRSLNLNSTDITKMRNINNGWRDYGVHYLEDLCSQVARKQQDLQIYKENDVEVSQKHFDTWNTFWGRPGHGAPRPIKNKLNLDDLLYKLPVM